MSGVFEPMTDTIQDHLKTLAAYPPVQGGTSFNMSHVVKEFVKRARQ
jgi:arylsulfatase